ncbi:hypothetical protein [Sphingobium abikonense]|uniref:hypothetical protein n=1 Tax=Sphingobium abikonense TaxID=86193 RepID=UPI003516CAA1
MLLIPSTVSSLPEWARKVANAVNYLIGSLGAFGNSVSATGAYTAQQSDYLILADASAGPVTVALPSILGKQLVIKKVDASTNAVTLMPAGAETIDGAVSLAIATQWQSYTIMGIAGGWAVL